MGEKSLYERLGGEEMLDKAVEVFYDKVLADGRINHFFAHVDMDVQKERQKTFLSYSLGGPGEYTGKDLRRAHAPLIEKGLSDVHFVAICEHLVTTLNELGVAPDAVVGVLTFLESKRDDVLCR